ncbi:MULTISPECIES: type VI secretion system contractile sheath large subunit [Corallococcus]|uniref:type VI secretion system contractile sheath large subunit n=1 Tax=Corallococcus TaxID=83461 RepID=UPI00117F8709|nr:MULTISPECIES: type VI secretion system contractile sheath large subunit [Corallococcus]NBD12988.1 type VI secretion system contractile sheath large subunit [Corallococcus silvisoli]TSC25780.1 type VI secretion system contractile sheath large subunit [Corallococcus sp. Z5C101001]
MPTANTPSSTTATTTAVADPPLDIPLFLSSVRLGAAPPARDPATQTDLMLVPDDATPEERFVSSLAAMVYNMDTDEGRFDKQTVQELVGTIDTLVADQLNAVLHAPEFQEVEAQWTALADLVRNTNFKANIELSLLDVSKEEAYSDLETNAADVAGSEFFKKLYVAEYDQYGGAPYGALVGLFEFANTPQDMLWLKTMGKIAAASHAPFVASVSPRFFGCDSMREVAQLRDVASLLDSPKYSAWNALRETDEASYVGLTLPRYIVRPPYNPETYPAPGMTFTEAVKGDKEEEYLWGNAAMLFARNLVRSFETSGWCQHIRGPRGGGLVAGLPVHLTHLRGEEEMKLPVEMSIPDFRELELANGGFIPLIHKKGSAEAVFFSVQSLKRAQVFEDPKDSENSQLVTNLAYTYSISRIAHYVKAIMRENIGSTAGAQYMQQQIERWISRYVTTLVNPDDLTLRYYPFKAYNLTVAEVPGKVGWFHCNLSVLPHIQFEGMNVDLRVDARLG